MVHRSALVFKVALVLSSLLLSISVVEFTFRTIDYDFGGQDSFEAWPIFFRKPVLPVGDVYFRRPGPAVWRGNVLSTSFEMSGGVGDVYRSESEVTITYDQYGFRNPENLTDWDVVVIGDSFTELGYLPYEDLFTTKIGENLGVRVKNLGVSYGGPLTYLYYLQQYGKAPSTQQALMVFFEGNDLRDLERENYLLQSFEITGERPYRNVKQSSFLKACYDYLAHWKGVLQGLNRKKTYFHNAYFRAPAGEMAEVSVKYAPPGKDQVTGQQREQLETSISEWSRAANSLGMKPWLVYMPCKRRVLDGYLDFTERVSKRVVDWQPSNLPELVREMAEENGVFFIDVTPALVEETLRGQLTYNAIWDTHLNSHGSSVASQIIAKSLEIHSQEQLLGN